MSLNVAADVICLPTPLYPPAGSTHFISILMYSVRVVLFNDQTVLAGGNFVSSLIISLHFLELSVEYVCGTFAVSDEEFIKRKGSK